MMLSKEVNKLSNWTLLERIEKAIEMAKYTNKYYIAIEAKSLLQAGKIIQANTYLKRYGF